MKYYMAYNDEGIIGYTTDKKLMRLFKEEHSKIPNLNYGTFELEEEIDNDSVEITEWHLDDGVIATTEFIMDAHGSFIDGIMDGIADSVDHIRRLTELLHMDVEDETVLDSYLGDFVSEMVIVQLSESPWFSNGSIVDNRHIIRDIICPMYDDLYNYWG